MTTLHLAALPSQTTKGTIVRLLEQVGQINRDKIGEIQLRGRECQRSHGGATLQSGGGGGDPPRARSPRQPGHALGHLSADR